MPLHHTLIMPLAGGIFIGLAVSLLWLFNAKITGISGILGGLFRPGSQEFGWQVWFLVGLLTSPYVVKMIMPWPPIMANQSAWVYAVAGLLVGFGTRLGSGCTSGHAICGNARLSRRSFVATLVFMFFGGLTVWVMRHVLA